MAGQEQVASTLCSTDLFPVSTAALRHMSYFSVCRLSDLLESLLLRSSLIQGYISCWVEMAGFHPAALFPIGSCRAPFPTFATFSDGHLGSVFPLPITTPPHSLSSEDLYIPSITGREPGPSAGDTPTLHEPPPPVNIWHQPCFLSDV